MINKVAAVKSKLDANAKKGEDSKVTQIKIHGASNEGSSRKYA